MASKKNNKSSPNKNDKSPSKKGSDAARKAAQRRVKERDEAAALAEAIALAEKERGNITDATTATGSAPSTRASTRTRNRSKKSSTPPASPSDMSVDKAVEEASPEKKKTRSSTAETPAPSALKQGRYTARPSTPAPERMHLHEHRQIIVEAGITLDAEDRYAQFLAAISSLITYCQVVDEHFVINPVKEGGREKDWKDPTKLPTSMTALGAYLMMSGNARIFEKQKSGWGTKGKKENRLPAVFFTFAISSDVLPAEIVARVAVDWSILGGMRIGVKELCYFDTCTPVAIYFLWNEGHVPMLLNELRTILESVTTLELGGASIPLPPLALRKQIPRIPGQVTADFNNLSMQAQMARRAWHIEVETKHASVLIELVRKVKQTDAINELWGRQVHFSEVADINTPSGEIKRYIKFAQRHVNFHCSMICEDISGITHLDASAPIIDPVTQATVGHLTLRQVLLKYLKMSDGSTLIAEIHQRGSMGTVEVIVPNTAEAESMVLMMNRQFPAFCLHYLMSTQEMDEAFIRSLLKEACCPTLFANINLCTWDDEANTITTPEQAAEEQRLAAIEKAPWYKDEFGKHMVDKMKQIKRNYTDPEALYDLDGERSVKTLNARNDPRTAVATEVEDDDDDDDEDDEDYTDEGSEEPSDEDSFTIGSHEFSIDLASTTSDGDTSMGSASKGVNKTPPGEFEVDKASTGNTRVTWSAASSADESAPPKAAGSG